MAKKLTVNDVNWTCLFTPPEPFHEVGCPHREWSKDDIYGHLLAKKKFEEERLEDLDETNKTDLYSMQENI